MQKTTNSDAAADGAAENAPDENNPIRKLMLPLMDPSEMTPEERMDELASILAMAFLQIEVGRHSGGVVVHHT
jgi:hypothetical protein